jgi:hypothetical protein
VTTKTADLWKALAKGQDLECIKCAQVRFWKQKTNPSGHRAPEDQLEAFVNVMVCDTCHKAAAKSTFSEDMQTAWEFEPQTYIQCDACAGLEKRTRAEYDFFTCTTCNREWPEVGYFTDPRIANKYNVETHVSLRTADNLHLATCAACAVAGTDLSKTTKTCIKCQRQMLLTGPNNDDCDG